MKSILDDLIFQLDPDEVLDFQAKHKLEPFSKKEMDFFNGINCTIRDLLDGTFLHIKVSNLDYYIKKFDDDWYIIIHKPKGFKYRYYLCDEFSSVIKFINDIKITEGKVKDFFSNVFKRKNQEQSVNIDPISPNPKKKVLFNQSGDGYNKLENFKWHNFINNLFSDDVYLPIGFPLDADKFRNNPNLFPFDSNERKQLSNHFNCSWYRKNPNFGYGHKKDKNFFVITTDDGNKSRDDLYNARIWISAPQEGFSVLKGRDEWSFVNLTIGGISSHFKCDQIYGVINCVKDHLTINNIEHLIKESNQNEISFSELAGSQWWEDVVGQKISQSEFNYLHEKLKKVNIDGCDLINNDSTIVAHKRYCPRPHPYFPVSYVFFIKRDEDDWYYIDKLIVTNSDQVHEYYKCDQIYGVVDLFQELFKTHGIVDGIGEKLIYLKESNQELWEEIPIHVFHSDLFKYRPYTPKYIKILNPNVETFDISDMNRLKRFGRLLYKPFVRDSLEKDVKCIELYGLLLNEEEVERDNIIRATLYIERGVAIEIYKVKVEWYYLRYQSNSKSPSIIRTFKCDQLDGVIDLINHLTKKSFNEKSIYLKESNQTYQKISDDDEVFDKKSVDFTQSEISEIEEFFFNFDPDYNISYGGTLRGEHLCGTRSMIGISDVGTLFKYDDEWYVYELMVTEYDGEDTYLYWKCDQWEGVIDLLNQFYSS